MQHGIEEIQMVESSPIPKGQKKCRSRNTIAISLRLSPSSVSKCMTGKVLLMGPAFGSVSSDIDSSLPYASLVMPPLALPSVSLLLLTLLTLHKITSQDGNGDFSLYQWLPLPLPSFFPVAPSTTEMITNLLDIYTLFKRHGTSTSIWKSTYTLSVWSNWLSSCLSHHPVLRSFSLYFC